MTPSNLLILLLLAPAVEIPLPRPGVERRATLSGATADRYFVDLAKDMAVSARIEQEAIAVVVQGEAPTGETLLSFDAPTGSVGPEDVAFVSGEGGRFSLRVRPYEPTARAGSYRLLVTELRPARARDRDLMAARRDLARGYERRNAFDYVPARQAGEHALELLLLSFGPDAVETSAAYDLLGYVYDEVGLFDRGADMFAAALRIRQRAPGVADSVRNETESNLAWLELAAGRFPEAERRFRSVAERRESAGSPEASRADNARTGQAAALRRLRRLPEAEALLRGVAARSEKQLGARSPRLDHVLRQLGLTLIDSDRAAEGESVCSRALGLPRSDKWGEMGRAYDLRCVGVAMAKQGRRAEAEPRLAEALAICTRELGASSLCAAETIAEQGRLARGSGALARANEALAEAIRIRAAVLPPTHPDLVEVERELAEIRAQ
jgi:tetratricopeptide (TPR) repeat protein